MLWLTLRLARSVLDLNPAVIPPLRSARVIHRTLTLLCVQIWGEWVWVFAREWHVLGLGPS